MKHRSEGATALLGMPGFVVGDQLEVDGEIWLHVESTAEVVGCSSWDPGGRTWPAPGLGAGPGHRQARRGLGCGGSASGATPMPTARSGPGASAARTSPHERAAERAGPSGDLPSGGRREGLAGPGPLRTSASAGTPPWQRGATTAQSKTPLAWKVEALSLDETVMLHAGPRRHTTCVTGFVDLHRGRLLDIVLGRRGSVVETWLERRDDDWLAGIDVVAPDPFRGYANGLLAQLGHAEVILDHFHAVRLATAARGRRAAPGATRVLGHRGRKGDPLYGIRRLLLVGAERHGERGRIRIAAGLA